MSQDLVIHAVWSQNITGVKSACTATAWKRNSIRNLVAKLNWKEVQDLTSYLKWMTSE